jgi:hypothetical protein
MSVSILSQMNDNIVAKKELNMTEAHHNSSIYSVVVAQVRPLHNVNLLWMKWLVLHARESLMMMVVVAVAVLALRSRRLVPRTTSKAIESRIGVAENLHVHTQLRE